VGARQEARLAWVLVLPLVAVMLGMVFYPLIEGLSMSTRSINFGTGIADHFVGLKNYVEAFGAAETRSAAVHTLGYLVLALTLEILGGLVVALVLNKPFRGRGVVFAIVILPWALPSVVSGVLWARIFNPDNGLLNSLLLQLHVIHTYKVWFASPFWSIALVTLVHVWGVLPLVSLILLAGLQSIPENLYHAARVDGAGAIARFRYITLPLLRPALAVALTTGTVIALAIFDEIFVLNGTALNTRSVMMQVYLTTFQQLNFGQGTALAVLLSLATGMFALVYMGRLRRAH
jgi:multiple sugar transport system permease protein